MAKKTIFLILVAILGMECQRTTTATPQTNGCQHQIDLFNVTLTKQVCAEIQAVKKKYGDLPNDLVSAYPSARIVWNRALNEIRESYSSAWSGVSVRVTRHAGHPNWRLYDLEDHELFFHLLVEYTNGPILDSRDIVGNLAEPSPHIKTRLDAGVRQYLNNRSCGNLEATSIRSRLNPVLLPDDINSCLQ